VRVAPALICAVVGIGGARAARELAYDERAGKGIEEPFAPSPAAAPFVSLGYRELMADLLLARVMPYFGGTENTAEGVSGLCEAVVAADPTWGLVYEWCAHAMILARKGVSRETYLRAIALLDRGAQQFPNEWRFPYVAGQIYILDLKTDDPAQRRAWNEKGSMMIEAAIRKPNAPAEAATTAAVLRSKLGQHQRAVDGLREMLLITSDKTARQRLLDKLAELEKSDAAALASELLEARAQFDKRWQREREVLSATMYILTGPRLGDSFDLRDLATGGRELVGEHIEVLPPPEDPVP
jgi:hypothetical protein